MIKLYGLTWRNPRGYDPLVETAKIWQESNTDVQVIWEQLPWIDFEHRLLASFEGKAKPYDLVMLDHPWIGTLIQHNYLRSWNEMAGAAYVDEIRERVVAPSLETYELDGHLWALPIDAACHSGLIRRDLIDVDELPRDWSQMASWARDRSGSSRSYPLVLSVNSVLGNCLFLAMMETQGTPAYTDADHPTCDADAAAHVLEIILNLLKFTPPGSVDWGPWDIFEIMSSQDHVAYCPQIFGYANYFDSTKPRRFKLTPCPALDGRRAKPILGGVGLAVTQQCQAPEQAWAYARFVMSEKSQRDIFPAHNGQPATRTAWNDLEINAKVDQFYTEMLPMMRQGFIRPRYAGFHKIELLNAQILQRLWASDIKFKQAVACLSNPLESHQKDLDRAPLGQ